MNRKTNPTSLTMATWNAHCIKYQKTEVQEFLKDKDIDIMLIQETQLKASDRFTIPNYTMHRADRLNRRGGGVAILIKNRVNFSLLPQPATNGIEIISGIVTINNMKTIIASVYKPPNQQLSTEDLEKLFEADTPTIAAGDYNSKHRLWNDGNQNRDGKKLYEYCNENDLIIHSPDSPTYYHSRVSNRSSTLDLFITKNLNYPIHLQVHHELNSDHLPVIAQIGSKTNNLPPTPKLFTNWPHFKYHLTTTQPIPTISDAQTLHQAVEKITKDISSAIQKATIIRNLSDNQTRPPLPKHIKDMIKEKNKLLKRARHTQDPYIKQEANRKTQQLKTIIKEHNQEQWNNKLIALKKGEATLYKLCKSLKVKPSKTIPSIRGANGLANTNEEKAETFADTMEEQFKVNQHLQYDTEEEEEEATLERNITQQTKDLQAQDQNNQNTQLRPVSPKEVSEIIHAIPKHKAPGPDNIPNIALRNLLPKQISEITNIINSIFRLKIFPSQWKLAHIIVIPKPNKNHTLPQNYRPISLLSSLGKISEKIILKRLTDELTALNVLPDAQLGFRPAHSTTLQNARLTDQILTAIHRKESTGLIALDVEKAFDKVWHNALIYKMTQLGFSNTITRIINSFLTNRTFNMKIKNTLSTTRVIEAGVPQGSPLSPLLYNIYTADIPKSRNTQLYIYADDTAIAATSKKLQYLQNYLTEHFNKINKWTKKWKIKINVQKTQLICVTKKHTTPQQPLQLQNNNINWQNTIKYLGINYDSKLTWRQHIENARNKATGIYIQLYPLLAPDSPLSISNKLLIYNMYIQPILTYGAPSWGLAAKTNIHRLQTLQNRILRKCLNAPKFVRNTIIRRDSKVPDINTIINQQKEQLQKITRNHENETIRTQFNYNHHAPLGRGLKLTKHPRTP